MGLGSMYLKWHTIRSNASIATLDLKEKEYSRKCPPDSIAAVSAQRTKVSGCLMIWSHSLMLVFEDEVEDWSASIEEAIKEAPAFLKFTGSFRIS